jgi:hypothetical protein
VRQNGYYFSLYVKTGSAAAVWHRTRKSIIRSKGIPATLALARGVYRREMNSCRGIPDYLRKHIK